MKVSAVILAAGGATRFGTPKQLVNFRGETLVCRAARAALAECAPVVVVTGCAAELVASSLRGLPLEIAFNSAWSRGLGTSIRRGVSALLARSVRLDALVLMLCDQPFVTARTIALLKVAHARTGCGIVASRYADIFGVPALFSRSWFSQLNALADGAGAKAIIDANLHDAAFIHFPEGAQDVDTAADLEMLAQRAG